MNVLLRISYGGLHNHQRWLGRGQEWQGVVVASHREGWAVTTTTVLSGSTIWKALQIQVDENLISAGLGASTCCGFIGYRRRHRRKTPTWEWKINDGIDGKRLSPELS